MPPPSADYVTPQCGTPSPASSLGPAAQLPANPVSVIASGFPVLGFAATDQAIYVFDGTDIRVLSFSGSTESSVPLPPAFTGRNANEVTGPYIDPSGDIWLDSYFGDRLAKFAASGKLLWSTTAYPNSTMVGFSASSSYELGLVQAGKAGTRLLHDNGRQAGSLKASLEGYVSETPDGDLLVSNAGYVRRYSLSGKLLSTFGDSKTAGISYAGGPYHFITQAKLSSQ